MENRKIFLVIGIVIALVTTLFFIHRERAETEIRNHMNWIWEDTWGTENVTPPTTPSTPTPPKNKKLQTTDFQEAMKLASEYDMDVILQVSAEWCKICKQMESEVLSDPYVKDMLSHCVFCKLDGDTNPNAIPYWKVKGYPTFIKIDKNANEIRRVEGYQSKTKFMEFVGS